MDELDQAQVLHSEIADGDCAPLGAVLTNGGINFCLFSRNALAVDLLFFDRANSEKPTRVISLDPFTNRTYHYWHVFVPDARPGQIYGYRVSGPFDPERGLRFDPSKVLFESVRSGNRCSEAVLP